MAILLQDVFNAFGYKNKDQHLALAKLAALRGCFGEEYKDNIINDHVADQLIHKSFASLQEGTAWWHEVTQKNWLRPTFSIEGKSKYKDAVINVMRWLNDDSKTSDRNEDEKQLLGMFRSLKLVDTVPWPDEKVSHVVFHGQLEYNMKERVNFIKDFKGKGVVVTNARGIFNQEIKKNESEDNVSCLAAILADNFFNNPKFFSPIQEVLMANKDLWTNNIFIKQQLPDEKDLKDSKLKDSYIFTKNPPKLYHINNEKCSELKIPTQQAAQLLQKAGEVNESKAIQTMIPNELLHGFRDMIAANEGHNRGSFKHWLKDLNGLKAEILKKLNFAPGEWPVGKGWYYKNPEPFESSAKCEGRQSLAGWPTVMDMVEFHLQRRSWIEIGKFRDITLEPIYSVRPGRVANTEDNIEDWYKVYGASLPPDEKIVFVTNNSLGTHEIFRQHTITLETLKRIEKTPGEVSNRIVTVGPGANVISLFLALDVLAKTFYALRPSVIKKLESEQKVMSKTSMPVSSLAAKVSDLGLLSKTAESITGKHSVEPSLLLPLTVNVKK